MPTATATSITIMLIHNHINECVAELASIESESSGIKISKGTASRARQQRATKPGSKTRHAPESRKFSVFAVPYACRCSFAGLSEEEVGAAITTAGCALSCGAIT